MVYTTDEGRREKHARLYKFDNEVALPLITMEIEAAFDTDGNAVNTDVITQTAVDTAITCGHIGPKGIALFPIAPIQIFELKYAERLAQARQLIDTSTPNLVVHSGAGGRIPEIWGEMRYPNDSQKFPDEQSIADLDDKLVFGDLPPNLHCAEPLSDASAEHIVQHFSSLLPAFSTAPHASLLNSENGGLLLTDDSHQDLIHLYRLNTIDKLVLLRLDPNSLISDSSFDISNDNPNLVKNVVESVRTLTGMLRLVKRGGYALFTIGKGNSREEQVTRRCILTGMRELLSARKIPNIEFYNPFAELMNRHYDKFEPGALANELEILTSSASLQGLIVPYSYRFDNLLEELSKKGQAAPLQAFRGGRPSMPVSALPCSEWVADKIRTAIKFVSANPELGSGLSREEFMKDL